MWHSRNTDYGDHREKLDSRGAYENIPNPVFGGAYTTVHINHNSELKGWILLYDLTYVYMYMYVCICTYICIHMYIYIYTYLYTKNHKNKKTQIENHKIPCKWYAANIDI